MTIAKDEIFGPVQSILKWDTLEEVLVPIFQHFPISDSPSFLLHRPLARSSCEMVCFNIIVEDAMRGEH